MLNNLFLVLSKKHNFFLILSDYVAWAQIWFSDSDFSMWHMHYCSTVRFFFLILHAPVILLLGFILSVEIVLFVLGFWTVFIFLHYIYNYLNLWVRIIFWLCWLIIPFRSLRGRGRRELKWHMREESNLLSLGLKQRRLLRRSLVPSWKLSVLSNINS